MRAGVFQKELLKDGENGVFVGGDVPGKVNHIYFDDIDIQLLKRTDYPGGVYDKRPCVGEGFVNDKVYGFYIDTASDIYINNPRLTEVGRHPSCGGFRGAAEAEGFDKRRCGPIKYTLISDML